jgi:hypothetical protein
MPSGTLEIELVRQKSWMALSKHSGWLVTQNVVTSLDDNSPTHHLKLSRIMPVERRPRWASGQVADLNAAAGEGRTHRVLATNWHRILQRRVAGSGDIRIRSSVRALPPSLLCDSGHGLSVGRGR